MRFGSIPGDDDCSCGHPDANHILVATNDVPVDGGIVLCPEPGCQCYATWGVNELPPLHVPDEAATAALRAKFQKVME